MLQFTVKFLVTAIVIVPVFLGLKWLWKQDIDLAKTFSGKRIVESITKAPSALVVVRDQDSVYQRGEPCGAVTGASIEESSGKITFREISNASTLDLSQEFEFRTYVLRMEQTETVIGTSATAPEKGTIIINCTCRIIGRRN